MPLAPGYGMPAYAKDGKVVFALKGLTSAEEKQITGLVKQAAS